MMERDSIQCFCGRLHPSPHGHDPTPASGLNASQAETGDKGQVSTSRAVQRLLVLPAAIAGVRCR